MIEEISCSIQSGSINLISGDNGSGKTTLAYALGGIIPNIISGRFLGSLTLNGLPINLLEIHLTTIFLFQNPYIFFSGLTFRDELCHVVLDKYSDLLPKIDPVTPLHKLSSGEQQRLAIALALSSRRPVTILDEPFEYLDVYARESVACLIQQTAIEDQTSLIVIDRPRQRSIAKYDQILTVEDGKLVENEGDRDVESRVASTATLGNALLTANDVSFQFPNSRHYLLKNFSFTLHESESIGIVGPNGCGKTTILLLLAGLVTPSSGNFSIRKREISTADLRNHCKLAFPNPDHQVFSQSVRDELKFGLINANFGDAEIQEQLDYAANLLDFGLDVDPFSLSFGQRKLLSIVATFILRPSIVLLDEPTASLDRSNLAKVGALIEGFLANGNSAVITSHDPWLIKNFCNTTMEIREGVLGTTYFG